MKLPVLAVRDSAALAFNRPITAQTIATAVRSFRDEANRAATDNTLYNHPSDFELWHLADFDEDSGSFEAVDVRCVCRAKDVKESGS
jgi:hypothetical protein